MKLTSKDIVFLDDRRKFHRSVTCGRQDYAGVDGPHIVRMDKIHRINPGQSIQQATGPRNSVSWSDCVPTNLRHLGRRSVETHNVSRNEIKTLMFSEFVALGHHQLHSQADANHWLSGPG